MNHNRTRFTVLVLLLVGLLVTSVGFAQAQELVEVEIEAADGKTLHGNYYPAPSPDAPAIVLLHQLYTTNVSWQPLIPLLHQAGYAVLAPDLRGWGRTQGDINWRQAQSDTLIWMDWLRQQEGVRADRIMTLGSSMGANLAIIGCANDNETHGDSGCVASVGISPGLNYYGYTPLAPALADGMSSRAVLMLASERDTYSARAVGTLPIEAPGRTDTIMIDGRAHGIDMLTAELANEIITWLNTFR